MCRLDPYSRGIRNLAFEQSRHGEYAILLDRPQPWVNLRSSPIPDSLDLRHLTRAVEIPPLFSIGVIDDDGELLDYDYRGVRLRRHNVRLIMTDRSTAR